MEVDSIYERLLGIQKAAAETPSRAIELFRGHVGYYAVADKDVPGLLGVFLRVFAGYDVGYAPDGRHVNIDHTRYEVEQVYDGIVWFPRGI